MSEYALHVSIANTLRQFAAPGVVWFHCPNGEARNAITGARLKKLGVLPGVADLIVLSPSRKMPCFLEIKSAKGRLSPAQTDFALQVKLLGCRYEIARSLDEAIDWLTEFGAIEAGRVNIKRREAA